MATFSAWLAEAGFDRPRGLLGRLGRRLMARGNAGTEQQMVRLAELQEHEGALVVGPGPGVGLRDAAQHSAHVVGIDLSPVMLDASRRRCTDLIEQGRVRLVQASAEQTRQPDCSVDAVISVNNVQIWPDQQAGCTELARVLRPGGRLLLSVHHKWLPSGPEGLPTPSQHRVSATSALGRGNRQDAWPPPRPSSRRDEPDVQQRRTSAAGSLTHGL